MKLSNVMYTNPMFTFLKFLRVCSLGVGLHSTHVLVLHFAIGLLAKDHTSNRMTPKLYTSLADENSLLSTTCMQVQIR